MEVQVPGQSERTRELTTEPTSDHFSMENIDLLCESSGVLPGDAEDKGPNDSKRETILTQDSPVAKEAAPPATAKATTSRKQKVNNAERAMEAEEGSAVGGFMAAIQPTPGQHRGKKEGGPADEV